MVEGFTNLTGFKSNLVYTVREVGECPNFDSEGIYFQHL